MVIQRTATAGSRFRTGSHGSKNPYKYAPRSQVGASYRRSHTSRKHPKTSTIEPIKQSNTFDRRFNEDFDTKSVAKSLISVHSKASQFKEVCQTPQHWR